ncbi:MAG: haloacid dehalogenase-like hydrolase [Candidatus Bathyarchaeota archaeon BA2]|nr:MAG: haloacid dehalogenase-like hydrolase [Candidatus Bathyarchaeota archaeon BA2]
MSYQCLDEERKIYFKKDSAKALSDTKKIIFDFDGVLVQTSQSYRQTIRRVVDYYFLEILGLEGERGKLVTLGDIQSFKDTGLYNNDWNLTYALIAYYLALLMRKLQKRRTLQNFTKRFSDIQFSEAGSFLQTLREIGDFLGRYGLNATELVDTKNDSAVGIESLLTRVRLENQSSLEVALKPILPEAGGEQLTLIRKLVPYNLEKPDLLKRLFEETYLGAKLFSKFYGVPSIFKFDESFIEKESFIPTEKTLDALRLRFGKFAIYSEKPRDQGIYLLEKNNLKEYFDENGLIFQEDIFASEEIPFGACESVQLGKPNPTFFIKMVEKLAGKVVYVGDGIADMLLIENARLQGLSNILFFGVLCSSQYPDQLFSQYVKHGADAVMTDVNDIPNLYASLGGKVE